MFSKTELSNGYGGPWLLRYNDQKEKDGNNSCILFSLGLVMFFVFFFLGAVNILILIVMEGYFHFFVG